MSKLYTVITIATAVTLMVVLQSYEAAKPANLSRRDTTPTGKDTTGWPATFAFGLPATAAEITAWDIDVRPDGKGLPEDTGTTAAGAWA